jgi:RNA polymerase sigma-70 factor (ECF subfamily)
VGQGEATTGVESLPENISDAELVAALKQRDERAVLQAYRKYSDAIYRYAYYQVGNAHLAEDVVADVFLRMIEKIDGYSYQGVPFSAWLYRIAHNLIADHFRLSGKMNSLLANPELHEKPDDPATVVETRMTVERLYDALSHLTEEQRQVIVLKFIEDYDNSQVAAILGKNEGAVKSLQHRALDALRRLLFSGESA